MKIALFLGLVATFLGCAMAQLPPLKVKGKALMDPNGNAVALKGVNLGNWFVIEMWMLGLSEEEGAPADQFSLERLLEERFGEVEKDRLMDAYRESWITERDFALIPSFGFNVVRLPMNYRLMEDDRQPFQLKKDAWKWIDRAVELSERNGLYVILDMHGAQGGQSPYDHTGHSGQNRLKEDETAQRRLAWLWGEIAKRYRGRDAVVAYDVINEPYGTPKDIQIRVFRMAYAEIRKNDPEKLIFAHGNYDDFQHYGDPKANGWHNVGFQMHYYPGLFGGGPPTLRTHARHLAFLETLDKTVDKYGVPFLIGEMNVVFDSAGGAQMMRRYFETHARYGWMTTMWSWKTTAREGGVQPVIWGATVNAEPMRSVDFKKDSKSEIEAYFRRFASEPIAVHAKLREALNGRGEPLPPLPDLAPRRELAPHDVWPGWNQADIGGARPGGLQRIANREFELFGGGNDVWGTSDQARFVYQEFEGDFEIEVEIQDIEDIHPYTKAGLMLRSSLVADDPTMILTSFVSGEVQMAYRDARAAEMQGLPVRQGSLPGLRLKIVRKAGKIEGFFAHTGGEFELVGSIPDKLPRRIMAGALALSHDDSQLVKIRYRGLETRKIKP